MRAPRGILLDLGNTLLRELETDAAAGHARLLDRALRNPRGVTAEDLRERAERMGRELRERREGSLLEFSATAFTRLLFESFDVELPPDDATLELAFWRAASRMEPEPHVGEALDAIASRGLPMGVVSNATFSERVLRYELALHGLEERFRFVMASVDYGIRKPHRLLFETAATKLGLRPDELWFIGDSLVHDMVGAREVGMRAVWYNPQGRDDPDERVDHELRDWRELEPLLA